MLDRGRVEKVNLTSAAMAAGLGRTASSAAVAAAPNEAALMRWRSAIAAAAAVLSDAAIWREGMDKPESAAATWSLRMRPSRAAASLSTFGISGMSNSKRGTFMPSSSARRARIPGPVQYQHAGLLQGRRH
jgi:hypothetical protein